jgi:hypothetical protein
LLAKCLTNNYSLCPRIIDVLGMDTEANERGKRLEYPYILSPFSSSRSHHHRCAHACLATAPDAAKEAVARGTGSLHVERHQGGTTDPLANCCPVPTASNDSRSRSRARRGGNGRGSGEGVEEGRHRQRRRRGRGGGVLYLIHLNTAVHCRGCEEGGRIV